MFGPSTRFSEPNGGAGFLINSDGNCLLAGGRFVQVINDVD